MCAMLATPMRLLLSQGVALLCLGLFLQLCVVCVSAVVVVVVAGNPEKGEMEWEIKTTFEVSIA